MDLRRLLRGKSLYVLIGVLITIALSTVLMSPPGTTISELLGGPSSESPEMAFMSASMGVGAIYGLIGLSAMLLICSDYSSGFAKNIFAAHTQKWHYVTSKILTLMVASAILMLALVVAVFIISLILGRSIAVPPLNLIFFLGQKVLVSAAFASIYTFINVMTRNKAVGTVFAFLIGTGGLVMGLSLLFGLLGIDGSLVTESTIHGSSTLVAFHLDTLTLLRITAASVFWTCAYAFLSILVLSNWDVV
jgi:ABC-type transport system involved in multi-copper enzyme maturation permease subunit